MVGKEVRNPTVVRNPIFQFDNIMTLIFEHCHASTKRVDQSSLHRRDELVRLSPTDISTR